LELKYFEVQLFHVTAIVLVYKYSVDRYCSNIEIGLTMQEYKSKLKLQNFEKQNTYFASNANAIIPVAIGAANEVPCKPLIAHPSRFRSDVCNIIVHIN
jgi:hypothetical protein